MTQHETFYPIVAIEGNIGAGKSTFVKWIQKYTGIYTFEESLSTFLIKYQNDPSRYAFPLQIETLVTRVHELKRAHLLSKKAPVCLDRGVYGDRSFALANWRTSHLSESEYTLYKDVYASLNVPKVDAVLYLDVSPETSLKRIAKRSRELEHLISLEYLSEIKRAHEEVLEDARVDGVYIHRIDWNEDADVHVRFARIGDALSALQSRLECFINART